MGSISLIVLTPLFVSLIFLLLARCYTHLC